VDTKESQSTVQTMHNALRETFSAAFTKCSEPDIRTLLSSTYENLRRQMVSISSDKGFPYVTHSKLGSDNVYEGRVLTRLGRWCKSTGCPDATDPMIGRMIDALSAQATRLGYTLEEGLSIEVLRGEDVVKAYTDMVGAHSCMTESASYRAWLYGFNPEVVGMAKASNGKARALLWTTIEGHTVLDRIYPNSGFTSQFMKNWALDQGYLVRNTNAARSSDVFIDGKGKTYGNLTVQISKLHPCQVMPYLDTFVYYQPEKMVLGMTYVSGAIGAGDLRIMDREQVGPKYGVLPDWEERGRKPRVAA